MPPRAQRSRPPPALVIATRRRIRHAVADTLHAAATGTLATAGGVELQLSVWLEGLCAAWWCAGVATFSASLGGALLQPRVQTRRARNAETPPVSLLLPIKLLNPGFARAQGSAFLQDISRYEVIIGAREDVSPALDAMRAMVDNSTVPARIVHSPGSGAVSPKLDTLDTPLATATHDVVLTKDSNITFSPDTARALLRNLTPDVGLVCAVPVAVRAQRLAGRIEAVLINRDARLLLLASALGKGYGVGKAMLFRRGDLARAGGTAALGYTIAEDTALSRALAGVGLRTVFSHATVDQEIGSRNFADVYGRQARWAVIRRAEEPVTFAFEPVACALPAAVAAMVAAPLAGLAPTWSFGGTLVGWYLVEVFVTALKGWEIRPWTPAAFLGRDLVLLGAWCRAWFTREVVWAGARQDVRDVLRRPQRPLDGASR